MKITLVSIVAAARSINPMGAAAIFLVAWLAGLAGSLAALFVALALFAGLYGAKTVASPIVVQSVPAEPVVSSAPAVVAATSAVDQFAGLVVREVKLAQPTGKPAKVTSAA